MAEPHRGNGSSEADRLRDLGREARDTGMKTADRSFQEARDSAAGRAQRTSEALHDAADRLEGDPIGSAMHMAADRLDELSDALRHQDLRGVLDQVQTFAQRQPALFVGGMMALGFALGRVMAAGGGDELAHRARDEVRRRSGSDHDDDYRREAAGGEPGVGLGAPSEATRPRPTATATSPAARSVAPSAEVTAPRDAPTPHDPSGRPH